MERNNTNGKYKSIKTVYHNLFIAIILLTPIAVFFIRLFYPESKIFMIPDFGQSDVLHLNLPFKEILSGSLKNRQWPLWTPLLSSGFPILAEGQIGTFYLPNLLLFRFLPTITAYNLSLSISFVFASCGIYLFCRKIKYPPVSSVFTSLVFTFSGYMSVHLNHFNLIQAASLLPLIFWIYLMLWDKNNFPYSIFFAYLLSQQFFTGHFYIVFITLVGLSILTLCLIFIRRNRERGLIKKRIGIWLITLGFTIGLSAIQLFPTLELWQLSGRSEGLDFASITAYPYPIKHLLSFIKPYQFGNPAHGTYPPFSADWGIFWENTAYIGVVPLILALVSLFFIRKTIVKFAWILLISSLLLVTGKYSPFYFVFSFPLFNLFRVPSKYLLLTTFSLTILAGFGFKSIIEWSNKYAAKKLMYFFILLIFMAIYIDEYRFSYNYPPVTRTDKWTKQPEILTLLPQGENKIITIGSASLWNSIFLYQGWQNMEPYYFFRNTLYPNYNIFYAIPQVDINTGGLTPRRSTLFNLFIKNNDIGENNQTASISALARNTFNLGGVNYLITSYKLSEVNAAKIGEIKYTGNEKIPPISLYYNDRARPRSYLAFNGIKISTKEEAIEKLSKNNFSNNNAILVENDDLILNNSDHASGVAEILSQESTKITLKTTSSEPGILVLADTNYPGWQAIVDGKLSPIYNVNLIQRGLLIPAGEHKITFVFNSSTFSIGKRITLVSLFIAVLTVFLTHVFCSHKVSGTPEPYPHL